MNQRLVCVCPALGVASEVWMHRQLELLRPHLVAVITWKHENAATFALPGVEIIVAPEALREQLSGIKRLWSAMRHPSLGPPRFPKPIEAWLRQQIELLSPDAVLGHYGHYATLVARVCHDLPVRLYAHFNGHDLSSFVANKPSYRRELTAKIPRFDGMIVVAQYMADWLQKQGASPAQISQIPYGIPLAKYGIASGAERNHREHCTFLAVGRLVAKKAPLATIRAFAQCHKVVPTIRLVMIGDGRLAKPCQKLVDSLGIGHAVEFRGTQSPARVRAAMADADVFVQHSVTSRSGDKEGWPVSIAEAMAARLPIVATRHAGILDQVEQGVSGFLGDENDVEAMSKSMMLLAQDADLRHQMGDNAHAFIAGFDCRKQVDALIRFTQLCGEFDEISHVDDEHRMLSSSNLLNTVMPPG
jgi:colanic acid/amylovoran biosynthesis glycosyltransferase